MFRQTNAKQTNAQARQPNKQMVKSAGRRSLPKQQKAATATTPKTKSIKKRLNIQPTDQFVYAVRNIANRISKVKKF